MHKRKTNNNIVQVDPVSHIDDADNNDFQLVTQAYLEKKFLSHPNRSRTYDLPVTSPGALPMSCRRLVS